VHPIDLANIYRRLYFQFVPAMRIAPSVGNVTGTATGSAFAAGNPVGSLSTVDGCQISGDLVGAGYCYITALTADARFA